jgi:phage terminase large subunit-like protein
MTRGERNIEWIENHLAIPEGKDVGKPFRLRPFQREIVLGIYDNPVPTRYAIISMARKNAKTTLSGALLLLHLCGPESTQNSQLYSTGQSREQAAVIYELSAKMVRASPEIRTAVYCRDSAKELVCSERGTIYKALAADAHTAHGKSPKLVIHDELGQVRGPRSALFDAMETADGAHENPLSIIISTQAPTDGDLLSVLIDDARRGEDPSTVFWLWTADETGHEEDAGWAFSEEAMRQANPAYGDFLRAESIQLKAERARRMPSNEATYRNLNLNQRIDPSSPLISRSAWQACAGEPDLAALEGVIFAGLDLSARNDLTALVYMAQDDDHRWHVWAEFFAPSIGVIDRARRDRVPYDVWARDGWITLTPGASVDYEVPATRLLELCADHSVSVVAFDRWRIDVFAKELARCMGLDTQTDDMAVRVSEGVPLQPYGQGFKDMAPAIDLMESALLNGQIRHGANPVLTWCAANARATRDPAGNRKLDKSKATGRIDGIQALAMAFGGAGKITVGPEGPSVYEERGLYEIPI